MFAHSLTRRVWQKAGHHNEQICSCKVTPAGGNCGLFVGVYVVRDGELEVVFTTVIFLSRVRTHGGDRCLSRCLYCSFLSSMFTLTHRVSVQSRQEREALSSVMKKKKHNTLMYRYVFRNCTVLCQSCVQLLRDILF